MAPIRSAVGAEPGAWNPPGSAAETAASAPAATDDGLLTQVAKGDRDAFSELYDRLAPLVLGIAKWVVHDPSQAEEVAQEALVDVWRTAVRSTQTSEAPGRSSPRSPIAARSTGFGPRRRRGAANGPMP